MTISDTSYMPNGGMLMTASNAIKLLHDPICAFFTALMLAKNILLFIVA